MDICRCLAIAPHEPTPDCTAKLRMRAGDSYVQALTREGVQYQAQRVPRDWRERRARGETNEGDES